MLRGIYTATSSLLTKTRELNTHANNVANLSTAGFKADRLVTSTFEEALALRRESGENNNIGRSFRGKKAVELYTDFTQGIFEETSRPLDLALTGEGFFMFMNVGEELYFSRNGQFGIDGEGYLVNNLGDYVLDNTESPIFVGRSDFSVTPDGDIHLFSGDYLGTVGVYVPEDYRALKKTGEETFMAADGLEPGSADFTGTIHQGRIEVSNTDLAFEMAAMIANTRSYQTMAQFLRNYDATLAKTISEVGRV